MERQIAGTLVPSIQVAALAAIVEELIAGGSARLRDAYELRGRAMWLGLNRQERAAVEAMRVRLCEGGITGLALGIPQWQ